MISLLNSWTRILRDQQLLHPHQIKQWIHYLDSEQIKHSWMQVMNVLYVKTNSNSATSSFVYDAPMYSNQPSFSPSLINSHEDCILPWLKINGTCPICRVPVNGSNPETP